MTGRATIKKTAELQPRLHETPAALTITLPSIHRDAVLPLVDVGSRKFEELCRDLLRVEHPGQRVALKRRNGQEQFGVDVEVFNDLHEPFVVVSCKCYKDIKAWEVRKWMGEFTTHLDGHWHDKGVKQFILAVTVESNDDDLNDDARILARQLAERGIKFTLWDSPFISDLFRKDPALVDRYFNDAWVRALSADVPTGVALAAASAPFTPKGFTVGQGALLSQIESLYTAPLSEALSKSLEEAIAALRRGRRSAVRTWLEDAQANPFVWGGANAETKAKGLRAVAMVLLGEGDVDAAARLLDDADRFQPAPDRSAHAFFVRATKTGKAAQDYLKSPEGRRERELMAALLLEDGKPKEALDVLRPLVGDDVSSEGLRLRAIATFIRGGSRSEALNLAVSAAAKEPDGAMALLTRGSMRVACALAEGHTPQFAGAPNPISKSLVISSSEARALLVQAGNDFDRLVETAEGEIKGEAEVWKLAALLLNPDTTPLGRAFARSLLSRGKIEPAVIVWALKYRLPIRMGRIKKLLGDALRDGNGEPGHVAVLALLSANGNRPDRGLAVLEKFGSQFPEAAEFFAYWRIQFSNSGVDPSSGLTPAIRHAVNTSDLAPLEAFLRSDEVGAEDLLAGAEFLASRDAFAQVDSLRAKLTKTRTARGVELAAAAALNTGDPRASIALLDDAGAAGIERSRRLVYVRVKAWEALGSHKELIEDLQALIREEDDPQLRDELLTAFLKIGALDRVKEQAEIVLDAGGIDERKAVQVAMALQSYAPSIARRALEELPRERISEELAGAVLDLSSRLGLTDLQDTMIRRLMVAQTSSRSFRKFERIEDAYSVLEESAKEYRSDLDDWLYGRVPAAAAMRHEAKDYVKLFLADPAFRQSRLGDKLPMMLHSGAYEPRLELKGARPVLRLDLSGLLMAWRAGIVDELDEAFEIEIPPSLPEALVLTEPKLHAVSPAAATAVRSIIRHESAVHVLSEFDPETREIALVRKGVPEDDKAIVAFAVDRAFLEGHLPRAQFDDVICALEISEATPRTTLDRLCLRGGAVVDLANAGVLEPVARAIPVDILRSDLDRLFVQVRDAEDEERVKGVLGDVLKYVSEKLTASRWRTVAVRSHDVVEQGAAVPAHARCLVETLPSEDEFERIHFWIEDRTLSIQPLPGAFSFPDVISHLADRGFLDKNRLASLRASLWEWGYLFGPIEIEEMAVLIESAPVEGNALVENSDLVKMRQWFANETLNLKYTNQNPQLDGEGRIVGEARRTVEIAGIVRDLTARLWRQGESDEQDLAARSNWAWSNLRLGYLPDSSNSEDPAARRTFALLTVVQVLSLPIHSDLGNAELPEGIRQSYMDWAMSSVVNPMAEADPVAAEEIAGMLASMLARVLEKPKDIDPSIESHFRNRMRSVVRDFLNLLPDEWSDKITCRKNIGKELGIEQVLLLDLDEKTKIAVRTLEIALKQWDRSPTAQISVELHPHGCGILQPKIDEGGCPTGIVLVGDHRIRLPDAIMALVYPEVAMREQMLLALPTESIGGYASSPVDLIDVARQPNVEQRVVTFLDRVRSDFARSRQLMWERASSSESIQASDFELPAPQQLLNFLGLPSDFRGSGRTLLDQAMHSLRATVGIEEAVNRLSSIPIKLPDELLKEFGEAQSDDGSEEFESINLFFVRLQCASMLGTAVPDDRVARGFADENAKLFLAALRHSAKQAISDETWRSLPAELAFCLVWLHADQLTRNVAIEGLDPANFRRWLASKSPTRILDYERDKVWQQWIVNCTLKLSSGRLRGAMVAEMLRRRMDVPLTFKGLVGQPGLVESWTPHPEVLVPHAEAPDVYWIADDPAVAMLKAGWIAPDNPFAERDPSALLERIMTETVDQDPLLCPGFAALLIDIDKVDARRLSMFRERLDLVADKSDMYKLDQGYGAFVDVFAKVCRRQGDRAGFAAWVRRTARENARSWPHVRIKLAEGEESGSAAIALLNAVYVYAWSGLDGLAERTALISEDFKAVADEWPDASQAIIACLDGLSEQIDVPTAAIAVLPTLLELRSR
ncbi:hypothetical protein [Rhizobium sp. BK060]|uniref:hypothetical protein n=1 Tax=Rhizobium sp. BK060 TaxID=2587096 RepID=UPI00161C2C81|nr:hypothetical protein [Rhizobium sp. BK060]MBB3398785.1 hypothetical protein [Rhizobium sp. BK060]